MFPDEIAICSAGSTYPAGNLKTVLKGKRSPINKRLLFPYTANVAVKCILANLSGQLTIKISVQLSFMPCPCLRLVLLFFVGDEEFLIGSF